VADAQLRLGGHMSVEPRELMSEVWTRWQGHVINGVFPLGRFLGCSDHSGVFLTRSAAPGPSEVAIKLVPTNRALAESQLPRWKKARSLAHPHLLGLLQCGGCQLDGLPYLYVVMEYADQTLAQLLRHRALTDDEVREMLGPTLDMLAFLHSQELVQGQLKPANILVVGDRLKLASDTIRRVSEGTASLYTPTAYDPPEVRQGSNSTAGDIWALGVTLLEALTGRPPSGSGGPGEGVTRPPDFSPTFRDVVARCLSPSPKDRPSVTELLAWAGGPSAASVPAAPIESAAAAPPEPRPLEPAPPRTPLPPTATAPGAAGPAPPVAQSSKPRALTAAVLGAFVILAVGWSGIRLLSSHSTPAPPPPPPQNGSLLQTPGAVPVAGDVRAPVSAELPTTPGRSDVVTSSLALHEVIPQVPHSAHRTIRGHIKVWVRVIVDQDGSVFAATLDRTGSSRYFQRLAIEAAKKWTFPPIDTPSRRLMQVRFDFSRDGITGRAVRLD
jgi:serine/threonine protein kinase